MASHEGEAYCTVSTLVEEHESRADIVAQLLMTDSYLPGESDQNRSGEESWS